MVRTTLPALALLWAASTASAGAEVQGVEASSDAPRILVFTHTEGFRHDSIPVAVETVQTLAREQGLQVDHTEDSAALASPNLARYRAVVFANTTGDVLDTGQQQALQAFVRAGGGFMGIHSAADTHHGWPWYGELVGAWFHKHPPGLQATAVQPEQAGHAHGNAWPVLDEIYNYKRNPRPFVQVLATVDEARYEGGTMGSDHPIAWCRPFEGGRTWYTGLGHDAAVYALPAFRQQLVDGLRYVSGLMEPCGK